jgi:hypothetical protein
MAIAAVANWDWPNDWPGLLENIVSSIKQRSDPQLGKCSPRSQACCPVPSSPLFVQLCMIFELCVLKAATTAK